MKALVKSQIIQGVISTGFELLKEYVSKKSSVSTGEIQAQQDRIRRLEAQIQQLVERQEIRSPSQVNQLSQAVTNIRNDYSTLLQGRPTAQDSGTGYFSASVQQDRAKALTAALYSLQNAYQSQVSAGIPIYIHDRLGPDQWVEEVDVYLGGVYAAKLAVNAYYPQASIRIDMTGEGYCPYTIVGQAIFFDQWGRYYPTQFGGQGIIQLRRGASFEMVFNERGLAELQPAQ